MSKPLDTVLLLALPASGKSETRRYLAEQSPEVCRSEFHLGETVQLDDFPYVHLMRRIDDELEAVGAERLFFQAGDRPFLDPRDWGTLIHLLNEDYADLTDQPRPEVDSAAGWLFERLDRASVAAGGAARLAALAPAARTSVASAVEEEARALLDEKVAAYPDSLDGKTVVIEFARGGPQGSDLPLPGFYGYRYSLGQLSAGILERASILYVWVTPEESRRKNDARTDPDDPGSILHHGVPISVMLNDYGTDDMDWLEANAERPGTVTVQNHQGVFHLPVARFDNREDKTSFIRNPVGAWGPEEVAAIHQGLKDAFAHLARHHEA